MRKGENLGQQFLQAKKLRFREVVIWHLGSHSQWQPKQNLNQKLQIQDIISVVPPCLCEPSHGKHLLSAHHLFGTLLFFLGLPSFLYIRLKLSLIVLPAQSPQTLEILASSYTTNLCIVFRFPCSPGQNPNRFNVLPSPSFLSCLVFCLAQRFVQS